MTEHSDNSVKAPAYFGSWNWNRLPLVPQEPISKEEAEQRKAYYIAYYNSDQWLVRFEKYLDGRPDWKVEYTYWENGKVKTKLATNAEGFQRIGEFDRKGRRLPQRKEADE